MASPGHRINEIRRRDGIERAIVFIHGFSGGHEDTWGLFPTLMGTDPAWSARADPTGQPGAFDG